MTTRNELSHEIGEYFRLLTFRIGMYSGFPVRQ